MITEEHNQQVARYWTRVSKRGELGFWNIPGWQEHQNILASTNPKIDWLDVLIPKALTRTGAAGIGLSLGCGGGCLEPLLLEKGLCSEAEGCDISADLIEHAQQKADQKNLPIKYFRCDLNNAQFAQDKYHFVIASGILHHVMNLEDLFAKIRTALKPRGVFLVYDYVGPTRFQWTDAQKSICNELLKEIPLRYRWKRGYPWHYYAARIFFCMLPFLNHPRVENWMKGSLSQKLFSQFIRLKQSRLLMKEVLPPPPEQFIVTDPSEAVRSVEILPLLRQYFQEEAFIPQGGTIAQPLFGRTVANFLHTDQGRKLAEKVLEHERKLIQCKAIPSDFVAMLLTKD